MIKSYAYPLVKRKIAEWIKKYLKSLFITVAMGGTIAVLLGIIVYLLMKR
jgi:hypothetical protein